MKYLILILAIAWLPVTGCDVVQEERLINGEYVATTFEVRQFGPDTMWVVDILAENGMMEMSLVDPEGERRVDGRLLIPGGVLDSSAIDQSFSGTYVVIQNEVTLGLDQPSPTFPVPTVWTVEGHSLQAGSPYTVVLEAR